MPESELGRKSSKGRNILPSETETTSRIVGLAVPVFGKCLLISVQVFGNRIENMLPSPGLLCTVTSPR